MLLKRSCDLNSFMFFPKQKNGFGFYDSERKKSVILKIKNYGI